MNTVEIVRVEDGSSVRADPATHTLTADPGVAALVLACARHASQKPAAEALAWFRGAAPPGAIASRPVTEATVELSSDNLRAVVRLADFRAVLAAAYTEEFQDQSLWLFRPDPIACFPSPGDRNFADVLESRVKALDEATRTGALGDPRESARRRIVLAEVRAAGILDEPLLDRKIEVVEEFGYSHLSSLGSAARALGAYYASPARARYVRHPMPHSIHVAPLSLDWARSVAQPAQGFTLFEWWAACEDIFLGFSGRREARGRTFLHQGAILAELAWRDEDGSRTTLYDVTLRTRSDRSLAR